MCAGQKRPGASWSAIEPRLQSHPFSGNVAGWLRKQAVACGLGIDDLVMQIAQSPYSRSSTDAIAASIADIQQQLSELRQEWTGSYEISCDPTKKGAWRAQPTGDRRRILAAASPKALRDLLQSRPARSLTGLAAHDRNPSCCPGVG